MDHHPDDVDDERDYICVHQAPPDNVQDDADLFYDMNRRPRGLCLIISNEVFRSDTLSRRYGTIHDRDALLSTFVRLHFLVEVYGNLSGSGLVSKLREIGQKDHSNYDIFVCCILSHGMHLQVYGSDGVPVAIRQLTDHVTSLSCPSLSGKPKVFIINACQGERTQTAADAEPYVEDLVPSASDMLLCFSTSPGDLSYRAENSGSFFVQKLCQCLREFADTKNLLEILTIVNHAVCRQSITHNGLPVQMAPTPMFSLRKIIFFGMETLRVRAMENQSPPQSPGRTASSVVPVEPDCMQQRDSDGERRAERSSQTKWTLVLRHLRCLARAFQLKPFKDYKIIVQTSSRFGAGTDAQVYVKLFGVTGDSGVLPLCKSNTHDDPFERGRSDEFNVNRIRNLGDLHWLQIWHDSAGRFSDWLLEEVEVIDVDTEQSYYFPCGQWLTKNEPAADLNCKSVGWHYDVTVVTGNSFGAGTDANVFIELTGVKGKSETHPLQQAGRNLFERGQTDTFKINVARPLGQLTGLRVWHDNSGLGAAWQLARIDVTNVASGLTTSFPCGRGLWLQRSRGHRTVAELRPAP